ncbi:hypothetical protein SDC9_135145 [bioreactor metagenome]|uniref:Uncharacterized protein n=2 Tax=root TaxID=1 RepID=A0A645DF20_9ZZZZ
MTPRRKFRDFDRENTVFCKATYRVGEDDFMTDDELDFCILCGPLADAVELLDEGNAAAARAIMMRVLRRAQELCERDQGMK